MHETTLKDWLANGYQLVVRGEVEAVRIMGRRPTLARDDLSPAGEYGWQFGWQWQDDTTTASSTIPEALFKHLPECPNLEVRRHRAEGRGIMPRWPSESEALAALDEAAWSWATCRRP